MQADRNNRHKAFAEEYEGSELKRVNARMLSQHMSDCGQLPADMLRELSTRAETTNPWYYGVYTLLRVSPLFHTPPCQHSLSGNSTCAFPTRLAHLCALPVSTSVW